MNERKPCMAFVNVLERYRIEGRIRSGKALTNSLHQDPLGVSKVSFRPAYRRGSPSRIEGLGSSINGVWGRVPQWVWAKPKVLFFARAACFGCKPKSLAETTLCMAKYSGLYFTWKWCRNLAERGDLN